MRVHLWSDLLAPATLLWLIGCGGSGTAHRDASSDGGGKEVPSIDGSHDSKAPAAIDASVDAQVPSSLDTSLIVPDSGGMDVPAEVARDANRPDSEDLGSPTFGDALDLAAPALADAPSRDGPPPSDSADASFDGGAVSDLPADQPLDIASTKDSGTAILDATFVDVVTFVDVAAADSAPDLPVCTPQLWYLDLDKDGFGNDGSTTTACTAPAGYVAKGGDCDDLDPLRYPGATDDPGFVSDRCGQGRTLDLMSSATGWTAFYSNNGQGGLATMTAETNGCRGGGLKFGYNLPDPTTCGSVSCAWVVMRKELTAPVDLHAEDYLLFPFHGDPGDASFQIELKLQDASGCMLAWAFKSATDLPAKRTAVVPLKWFTTSTPDKPCTVDLSTVKAVEIGIKGELSGTGTFAADTGNLHVDAITALTAAEMRMSPTHFDCPGTDTGVRSRIVADFLQRHKTSLASHGHPFVASWFEESPSQYWIYNQALLLAVFSLDAAQTGNADMRAAAKAVADELVSLQGQIIDGPGRWYDAYKDSGTGLVPSGDNPSFSWYGNPAWVVIALDLYRDLLAPSPRKPYDDSIALAATWLESKIAAFGAAGNATGAITEGTEGNVSTFFALVAAERFARAGAMKTYLLGSPWKSDEKRFWMGVRDPGLAIDVMGNWGSSFLRAVGENDKALAGLGLAAGLFPAKSFDGTHVGLGDIAGPWQPTMEFTGQYISAGGPGSPYLRDEWNFPWLARQLFGRHWLEHEMAWYRARGMGLPRAVARHTGTTVAAPGELRLRVRPELGHVRRAGRPVLLCHWRRRGCAIDRCRRRGHNQFASHCQQGQDRQQEQSCHWPEEAVLDWTVRHLPTGNRRIHPNRCGHHGPDRSRNELAGYPPSGDKPVHHKHCRHSVHCQRRRYKRRQVGDLDRDQSGHCGLAVFVDDREDPSGRHLVPHYPGREFRLQPIRNPHHLGRANEHDLRFVRLPHRRRAEQVHRGSILGDRRGREHVEQLRDSRRNRVSRVLRQHRGSAIECTTGRIAKSMFRAACSLPASQE